MKQLRYGLALIMSVFAVTVLAVSLPDKEIDHLLQYIATSSCRFIRNGSSYPADEAGAHITRKYDYLKSRIKNAEEFIQYAASESSFTHQPYRVNCVGKEQLSRDWLLEELLHYRQTNSEGQRG